MPVRCGNHHLSRTEHIRKSSGRDLRLVEIRRQVNVCGTDESPEIVIGNEAVEENHAMAHAKVFGEMFQTGPVSLTFARQ